MKRILYFVTIFALVWVGANTLFHINRRIVAFVDQMNHAGLTASSSPLDTLGLLSSSIVGTPESAVPGGLDLTFNPGAGTPGGHIQSLAIQADSKILMGVIGATTYNGGTIHNFARANIDGSNDTTLIPAIGISGYVYGITTQSDAKIVTGGNSMNVVDRYKDNGSIDTLFIPPFLGGSATAVAMASGNKIMVGGMFTKGITRLNTDGSLDTTFTTGSGANGEVDAIAMQPDGKILIGGNFTMYNGVARTRIARLNTNGTLDTTFNPGAGVNNKVSTIALQSDGKILIGGNFTGGIARYNTDGSVDTTFTTGTGPGPAYHINAIVMQPSDGKSIIGGNFASYNGVSRNTIARLNTDGSLDTTFDPGLGTNGEIYAMALQSNGQKLIIAGDFTSYNGITRNNIARITVIQPNCAINNLDVSAPTGVTNFTVTWSTSNCIGLVLETNTGAQRQQYTVPTNGNMTYTTTTTRPDVTLDVSLIAANATSIVSATKAVVMGGLVPLNSQCGLTALTATPATVTSSSPTTTLSWSSPASCQVELRAWTPNLLGIPTAVSIWDPVTHYFSAVDSVALTPLKPTAYSVMSQSGIVGSSRTVVVTARTIDVKKQ